MFNIYRAERVLHDEQSQTLEAQKEQKRMVAQISMLFKYFYQFLYRKER